MSTLNTLFSNKIPRYSLFIFLLPVLFFALPYKKTYAQGIPVEDTVTEVSSTVDSIENDINVVENTIQAVAEPVTMMASISSAISEQLTVAKEYVGDTLANSVAKAVLRKITADTVAWINSGFKGNPAFVTNPNKFFLNVGDQITSDYMLSTKSPLNALCSPFKPQIRLAMVKNYLNPNFTGQCTISKIVKNFDDFTNNFSHGGWAGWISMTQTDSNNPFGAYHDASEDLSLKIMNGKTLHATDLNHGNGFLSAKKCPAGGTYAEIQAKAGPAPTPPTGAGAADFDTQTAYADALEKWKSDNFDGSDPSTHGSTDCVVAEETVTPGGVIASKLNKSLGLGDDTLLLTNSINQLINALFNQMISQVFSSVSGGLRSLSQGTPSNPRSLLEQLQKSATASSVAAETAGLVSTLPPSLQGSITGASSTDATNTPLANVPSEEDIRAKVQAERLAQLTAQGYVCTDPSNPKTCFDTASSTKPKTTNPVTACTDPNDPTTCTNASTTKTSDTTKNNRFIN